MNRLHRSVTGVRVLAVLAVVGLTALLGWLLPRPGYSESRLLLFGAVAAVAWTGAAGVLSARPSVAALGALGLFLLGFWQAVLWIGTVPAAVALAAAAVAMRARSSGPSPQSAG